MKLQPRPNQEKALACAIRLAADDLAFNSGDLEWTAEDMRTTAEDNAEFCMELLAPFIDIDAVIRYLITAAACDEVVRKRVQREARHTLYIRCGGGKRKPMTRTQQREYQRAENELHEKLADQWRIAERTRERGIQMRR